MALSRSMKNLMHDRAQQAKPMRAGVSRSMSPQQAKPGAPMIARFKQSQRSDPRGGTAKITPPGRPGAGTFGFANKQGVRGAFQAPRARAESVRKPAQVASAPSGGAYQAPRARAESSRIRSQVAGTTGPVPGRRGGGIPRAFGSRQYLR